MSTQTASLASPCPSADLAEALESGADVILIDVRSPPVFRRAHIKNAINVCCGDTLLDLAALLPTVSNDEAQSFFEKFQFDQLSFSNDHDRDLLEHKESRLKKVILCGPMDLQIPAAMVPIIWALKRLDYQDLHFLVGGVDMFSYRFPSWMEKEQVVPVELTADQLQIFELICPFISGQAGDGAPSLILPHLYLGSYRHARNSELLHSLQIENILNAAEELPNHFEAQIRYVNHRMEDDADYDIGAHFDAAADFIHDCVSRQSTLLVHCMAGASRSASLVLYYLMKHQNMNFQQAFTFAKEKRPQVCPNEGFMCALSEREELLYSSRSIAPSLIHLAHSADANLVLQHNRKLRSINKQSISNV